MLGRRALERLDASPRCEQAAQLRPDLVRAGELEALADRPEEHGGVASERLRGGLRDRVECRDRRQRLAEHGSDAEEALLHLS